MGFKIELWLHTVIITENQKDTIKNQEIMHVLLGNAFNENNCEIVEVGGSENHVHILFNLNPELSIDELLINVRNISENQYKNKFDPNFKWSNDYIIYSVSFEDITQESNYIKLQKKIHKTISLQRELSEIKEQQNLNSNEEITDFRKFNLN